MADATNKWEHECRADDCTRPAGPMNARCGFHRILDAAPWLTAEDLDLVREQLADVSIYTEEEKQQYYVDRRLRMLRFDSKRMEMDRHMAAQDGLAPHAIGQAIADGIREFTAEIQPRICQAVSECPHYALKNSDYCNLHAPRDDVDAAPSG